MNNLIKSLDADVIESLSDTGLHSLDLFFALGASRNTDSSSLVRLFNRSLSENIDLAVRIVLHARDIRGGKGERKITRELLKHFVSLYNLSSVQIDNLLNVIVEIGRYDDLFHIFVGTRYEMQMLHFYCNEMMANDLAVKWAPREHSRDAVRRNHARILRRFLEMTPRNYRRMLSSRNTAVEVLMSSKRWKDIEYSKLPSKAAARYHNAFEKNDFDRYSRYVESLVKGETKINAGAIYPHDVLMSGMHGNRTVADQQWKSLPNYIENDSSFLPIVDTSGSMTCGIGTSNVTPLEIAVSLGMYCAERNKSAFANRMINFSTNPVWIIDDPKNNIVDRYNSIVCSNWSMSTNLLAAFKMILDHAVKNEVSQDDLPKNVLVLSDMQFNSGTSTKTAFADIDKMYRNAGYFRPNLIWWNLDGSKNSPVKFDETGTCLVSGFSPAVLTAVFKNARSMTPLKILFDAVAIDRYRWAD